MLKGLPQSATVVGVGTSLQEFQNSKPLTPTPLIATIAGLEAPPELSQECNCTAGLNDADWGSVNVLLSFGPPVKGCLQDIWPRLQHLEWLHSTTAGVEHIMFPELRDGPVTLTNAKVHMQTMNLHGPFPLLLGLVTA